MDEPAAGTDSGYERLGPRRLGLFDVLAQSFGFLGPVFSAAFLIPLVVGVTSASGEGGGVAAPISVLLAAVGVIAIGWLVARYARDARTAGGLYDYVVRGLGERAGVAAGFLYYAGVLLLCSGLVVLIGGYLHDQIKAEFAVAPLPQWAWSALVLAALLVVLHTGARISTRTQLLLALTSLLVVTAFFVEVVYKLGHQNSTAPFHPTSSAQGWKGIFFGVLYGVLLFVGFESAANLAEESKSPRRSVPFAVMGTAVIASVFFVAATYVEIVGFHFDLGAMKAAANAPLFSLGMPVPYGGFGGLWTDRLLELVVLLDMLAVSVGTGVSSSRGLFALGRDRRLPAPFALVSKRHGTPTAAILTVGVVGGASIVISEGWGSLFALPNTPHYFAIFAWCSTFGAFAVVFVYLLMCIGSMRTFGKGRGRAIALLAALVGIVITGGAVFASFYKVAAPTSYAPYAALGVLAAGIVVALTTNGRRRESPAGEALE